MTVLFERRGEHFLPTEHCASPWGPVTIHGGASIGLLAWALEQQMPPNMLLARLTVDLFRPVPRAPLGVAARLVRATHARISRGVVLPREAAEVAGTCLHLALDATAVTGIDVTSDAIHHSSRIPGGMGEKVMKSLGVRIGNDFSHTFDVAPRCL